jgi:hypothetical protein
MARRLVESLVGVGEVFAADVPLRSIPYQLSVWRDDEPSRDGPTLTIDGHIDITGIAEAVVLAGPQDLRLRLEDGRQLQFALTDTGGRIVVKAGFQPASES